jgi:hypothetical protein
VINEIWKGITISLRRENPNRRRSLQKAFGFPTEEFRISWGRPYGRILAEDPRSLMEMESFRYKHPMTF